jgi:uncharacterized protein (TIGR02246 family)
MTDLEEIQGIVAGLETAWNAADGQAFAARFAENADFVNIYGMHAQGRPGIAEGHHRIFQTVYAGSTLNYQVQHIRMLREDVALVHIRARLAVPQGPMAGELESVPSMVVTREPSGWMIAAFHNTLLKEPPALHNNGKA